MKSIYALLSIIILIISLFSCHKKEGTVLIPTIDSSKSNSISVTRPMAYPYTDTFIGTYSDAAEYNATVIDSPFVFYVVYPNPNQIVFMNATPIYYTYTNQLFIKDTFGISRYTYYQAGGYLFNFNTALNLSFSWGYNQSAGCEGVAHYCTFSGMKTANSF